MELLRELARDATFALRLMRKGALATATIVLCLGFSIGATATVVAWMEGLVPRPVRGVAAIDRLVSLATTAPTDDRGALSYPAYRDARDAAARAPRSSLAGVAAFAVRRFNLRTNADAADAHAEPVWGMLATASYFDVL